MIAKKSAAKSRKSRREPLERLVQRQRSAIMAAAGRRGASNVRIFGSVARGESGPGSDVDFLVDLELGASLLDLCGLKADLEELLGCNVDVATKDMLHWYIHDKVLAEAVTL
jgi:hypothetical protein